MNIVKVSVIIPVYNVEKYLRQCLDSVVNQTLQDIEIILVDDCSTDSSLDICNEYAKKDARVKVFHQKNLGSGAARNRGIDSASGEFIVFLDSDDYYPERDILETLYNNAKKHNVNICGGSFAALNNNFVNKTFDEEFAGYTFEKDEIIHYKNYQFDYGYHRFVYNRQFLKENNIKFPDFRRFQDPPFFVQAMFFAEKFYALTKITYLLREGHKSVKWTEKQQQGMLDGIDFNLKFAKKNKLENLYKNSILRLNQHYNVIASCGTINTKFKLLKIYLSLDKKILKNFCPELSKRIRDFYLHTIFSLKNQNNHKVLTILGVKFKFKRKCKCCNKILNFKTVQNLTDLIRNKIFLIPTDIDLIVGIPRSGIIPAYLIALFLNKNVCSLNEFVNGLLPQKGERPIACSNKSINKKKVLIVDDSIYSGNALQKTKEMLSHTDTDKYSYEYCCIYAKKETASLVDYYFEIVDPPRVFQWNYLNHSFVNQCCFDMDGVLCVDPTNEQNDDGDKYLDFLINAKSLYIPAFKIHSVVTSRLEKYREQTEYWLKKNNVLYGNLYMLDLPSAAERQRLGCHAKFKADIFAQIKDCNCFIESDRTQAEFISKTTGKQCICVATDELFGGNNE